MRDMIYTNVQCFGGKILLREVNQRTGRRERHRIDYSPTLFVSTSSNFKSDSTYKNIKGDLVEPVSFDSIQEAKEFIKNHSDISNFHVYGMHRFEYSYISDEYPDHIDWNREHINVCNIDIEVGSENGFPDPSKASEPITAITMKTKDKFVVFGCGDFVNKNKSIRYIKCRDELDLIKRFLDEWTGDYPDIITGWNCLPVDTPVWTKNKIVKLDSVPDSLHDSIVMNRSPKNFKRAYDIRLSNGSTIRSSNDHIFPIRVCEKGRYTSFPSKKKSYSDMDIPVKDFPLEDSVCFLQVVLNENLNPDDSNYSDSELYLAGLIYTDGTLKNKNKPTDGYSLFQSDFSFMKRLDCYLTTSIQKPIKGCYSRNVKRSLLGKAHYLIYNTDNRKSLDLEGISLLSGRQFRIFLAGLLDGDGFSSSGRIGWCNYNGDLDTLEQLSWWNGIFTTRSNNSLFFNDLRKEELPLLKDSRWGQYQHRNTLGRKSSQKSDNIKFKKEGNIVWVRIVEVEDSKEDVLMMDIETNTSYFVAKGIRTHNCKFFDIPYLVNRITNKLSMTDAKRLSPWNFLIPKSVVIFGKEQHTFFPIGVAVLDYIDLYKKFAPKGASQESYSLNNIAHEELKEKKLSYEEYGNLHNLYKENFQLFIEYNIRDVELVEKLDNKLRLIDLVLTLAYNSKTNYEDVFSQVRMWDSLIYNHLRKKNIVIPPMQNNEKDSAYVGAYVKEPVPGSYNWVVSFDVASLYPSLIQQYNISPEMIVEPDDYNEELRDFIESNKITVDALLKERIDTSVLRKHNVTLTPNGHLFRTDRQGFLSEMMEEMFRVRSEYKDRAKEAKKKLQKIDIEIERRRSTLQID